VLAGQYAICKLAPGSPLPQWTPQKKDQFCSVTRTSEELSIVCLEGCVPPEVNASRGWVGIRLIGPFAFSEIGVLSSFLDPLAEQGIGIFAISTFDTDYVLIEARFREKACEVLRAAGHEEVPYPAI
jgi:uncharacterized protein